MNNGNNSVSRNQWLISLISVIFILFVNIGVISFQYGQLNQMVTMNERRISGMEILVTANSIQITRVTQIAEANSNTFARIEVLINKLIEEQ